MAEFGAALRDWRTRRRMSQLDLGLSANVSARHISFLETGRSRPSRGMILRLCERLQIPLEGRNQLLAAAGLAPAYGSRARSAADLKPVQAAQAWMLERHAPYPAYSVDRHWRLVALNGPAQRLMGAVGLAPGDSLVEAFLHNPALIQAVVNREEVLRHGAARLRTESSHFGGDPILDAYIAEMEAALPPSEDPPGTLPAIIPTIYRLGDLTLSLFATIGQFGTAEDVALSEIKIELLFPADAASDAALHALAGLPAPPRAP